MKKTEEAKGVVESLRSIKKTYPKHYTRIKTFFVPY